MIAVSDLLLLINLYTNHMIRDGGKWSSKDHHLVVIKIPKMLIIFWKMLKMAKESFNILFIKWWFLN